MFKVLILNKVGSTHVFPICLNRLFIYIFFKIKHFFYSKNHVLFFPLTFPVIFSKVHFRDLPFNLMGVMVFTWFQKTFFDPFRRGSLLQKLWIRILFFTDPSGRNIFFFKVQHQKLYFFIKKHTPSIFQVKWSIP